MTYIDIQEMKKERDAPWDSNEHIVDLFHKSRASQQTTKQSLQHA